MRLRELLKCVQISENKYKNYKQRGQLPFRDHEEFSIPPGERLHKRWSDFSLSDALRLQVMVNLSEHKFPERFSDPGENKLYEGLPPHAASVVAREGVRKAVTKFGGLAGLYAHPEDMWVVTTASASSHQGELYYSSDRFAGTLTECANKIEELKENQVRAILFNASQVLSSVLEAGQDGEVPEVLDFVGRVHA